MHPKFKYATPFNTNILRISLNVGEEMIARVLVAEYNIAIDEKMLKRSIKTRQMQFLYTVYAFNKNYEYIGKKEEDELATSDEESKDQCCTDDHEETDDDEISYKTYTYRQLIAWIIEFCEDEAPQRVKQVANWKL